MAEKNVVWHEHKITREDREKTLGQKACLMWFTGLSGSGKSTVASIVEEKISTEGKLSYILDGDNVRHGLNSDLGFSEDDRTENIRRVGEVGKLFVDAGMITMTAFISPFKKDREVVREKLGEDFIEVFVKCSLEDCEERDPKGLYKKARAGEIKDFTGIHQDYEEPDNPEITINTSENSAEECADKIIEFLKEKKII